MESNFEYVKTLYENECQRIVKCKDIRNNQVYIYNTIINSNLIKLVDTNILSKIKSNILKVSKSADRIYIVSTPFDEENQTMLKDYIMNNNLTLRSQFNLAEQLVRLFIDIYSTSDLLQYKIINYDNISVDKEENIICNGYLQFRDEFDLSDNFTYKSIGNMIHYIFSKEEIDDYDISENIPPDVLKIIVKCLTRDYFHPKDLLSELINCPIYGIINCDSTNPATISRLSLINKNVSENETVTLKTNNSISMDSIDPTKKYNAELTNDKKDINSTKHKGNYIDNNTVINSALLGKAMYDNISKKVENDCELTNQDINDESVKESILEYNDELTNQNIGDYDSELTKENILTDNNEISEENTVITNDELVSDNILNENNKLADENIINNNDELVDENKISSKNNDNLVEKDSEKENVIDIYFNKKGSYEDKLLNGKNKPKHIKKIVIAVAILLVCGITLFLCKDLIFNNDKETVKDNDNEIVHNGDNSEKDKDNSQNNEEEDDDNSENSEGSNYSDEVSDYISDDIINKYNYSGAVAKEVKSDYYDGKTSLLVENEEDESKKVLFAIIDFSNENYSYLLNKQFQMSAAFKSEKDLNVKLIIESYSGEKLVESKVDNFGVSNDLWTIKTTNRKVSGVNRINLYVQIEGSNRLWIDSVKAEIIK